MTLPPGPPPPPEPSSPSPAALLTVRSAVIFLGAFVTGGTIGALTYWANLPAPASIAAGLATFGSAVLGLNAIIR